jgi:hypothetical protein
MFQDSVDNIDELTTSVTSFISKCRGGASPIKSPGLTEFGAKLKSRTTAHRAIIDNPDSTTEDRNNYKKARYDLRRVTKRAKGQYRNKVEL